MRLSVPITWRSFSRLAGLALHTNAKLERTLDRIRSEALIHLVADIGREMSHDTRWRKLLALSSKLGKKLSRSVHAQGRAGFLYSAAVRGNWQHISPIYFCGQRSFVSGCDHNKLNSHHIFVHMKSSSSDNRRAVAAQTARSRCKVLSTVHSTFRAIILGLTKGKRLYMASESLLSCISHFCGI